MNEKQDDSSLTDKTVGFIHLILYAVSACATTSQIILRVPGTVGRRHFGIKPLIGWFIMLFFCGMSGYSTNANYVIPFIEVSFVILVFHGLVRNQKERRGNHVHSHYIGTRGLVGFDLCQVKMIGLLRKFSAE